VGDPRASDRAAPHRASDGGTSASPWLGIIGIGEEGVEGLSERARSWIEKSEVVFGGSRQLALAKPLLRGDARAWPKPFDSTLRQVFELRGRRVTVLASGDPFHYGVGPLIAERSVPEERFVVPGVGSFSWAAARLGWSLQKTHLVSAHGRPLDGVRAALGPGARLLVLTSDESSPEALGRLLVDTGWGEARLHVLERLGGPRERVRSTLAARFDVQGIDPLNVVAIECPHTSGEPSSEQADSAGGERSGATSPSSESKSSEHRSSESKSSEGKSSESNDWASPSRSTAASPADQPNVTRSTALSRTPTDSAFAGPSALGPSLTDEDFEHDGQITKREIRWLSIAELRPRAGQLLWDVGAGSGSIAIEWLRLDPSLQAIAIEARADRVERIRRNAEHLGVERLELVSGRAPEALCDLPAPDAIFVGGGISPDVIDRCLAALAPGGRLVANTVTFESEACVRAYRERLGGQLIQLAVSRAEPLGAFQGWKPARPIVQWSYVAP